MKKSRFGESANGVGGNGVAACISRDAPWAPRPPGTIYTFNGVSWATIYYATANIVVVGTGTLSTHSSVAA